MNHTLCLSNVGGRKTFQLHLFNELYLFANGSNTDANTAKSVNVNALFLAPSGPISFSYKFIYVKQEVNSGSCAIEKKKVPNLFPLPFIFVHSFLRPLQHFLIDEYFHRQA
jgi:hypothetical protein